MNDPLGSDAHEVDVDDEPYYQRHNHIKNNGHGTLLKIAQGWLYKKEDSEQDQAEELGDDDQEAGSGQHHSIKYIIVAPVSDEHDEGWYHKKCRDSLNRDKNFSKFFILASSPQVRYYFQEVQYHKDPNRINSLAHTNTAATSLLVYLLEKRVVVVIRYSFPLIFQLTIHSFTSISNDHMVVI